MNQYQETSLNLYMKEIRNTKILTSTEEVELSRSIKKGCRKALNTLITANLKFVVNVAMKYQHQGMALNDLVAVGNLGLIRAASRFDGSKNFKFISYAVWWIRQAILQALADQSRTVRIPLNKIGEVYSIGKTIDKLEGKLHREASADELARELEIAVEDVHALMRIASPRVSLDKPNEDDTSTLMETIPGDMSTDEAAEENSLRKTVDRILNVLSKRERLIMELYFGIREDGPLNLEQIGEHIGITRERVRQIRNRALRTLQDQGRKYTFAD